MDRKLISKNLIAILDSRRLQWRLEIPPRILHFPWRPRRVHVVPIPSDLFSSFSNVTDTIEDEIILT